MPAAVRIEKHGLHNGVAAAGGMTDGFHPLPRQDVLRDLEFLFAAMQLLSYVSSRETFGSQDSSSITSQF